MADTEPTFQEWYADAGPRLTPSEKKIGEFLWKLPLFDTSHVGPLGGNNSWARRPLKLNEEAQTRTIDKAPRRCFVYIL
ncbi:hypothetical protein AAIH25_17580 [Arthrobacter crystallopoietes]|uniref:hypothetical protein n=1 Tax=Micrococcaceae TaxID=1268 RepID=UPI0021C9FD3D|nr:hypothetical protein [Arthrobacter sp. Marseille-P9274]